jgi:hypothetical protein
LGSAGADDYVTRSTFNALNQSISTTTSTTPGVGGVPQKTSTSVFEEFGSVRAATDPNGVVTGTTFDKDGHPVATYEIDPGLPASQTSASTYDSAGRLATSQDPRQVANSALGDTLYGYDDLGQQNSVTDAYGSTPDTSSVTTTSFDGLGRELSETGAFSSTSYTNDLGGRVTRTDDGLSCSTSTYDFADRQSSTTTGLGTGDCTDGGDAVTTTNTYDGLGRLTLAQITAGVNNGDKTANDTYDSSGDKLTDSTTKAGVVATATSTYNLLGQRLGDGRVHHQVQLRPGRQRVR